jgi:hypothetical protein
LFQFVSLQLAQKTPGTPLLRHANSKITLDVYTQAVNSNKRAAQSKVVKMMVSSVGTKVAVVGTSDSTKQAQNAG